MKRISLLYCLMYLCLILPGFASDLLGTPDKVKEPLPQQPTIAEAMGFDVNGAWVTAPFHELQTMDESKLWSFRARKSADYLIEAKTLQQLSSGAVCVTEPVQQGKASLRWADLPTYPTLSCRNIITDWSQAKAVCLDIYSETITNDVIYFAVSCDNPATNWRDYRLYPFAIDWQGWKTIIMPLADFDLYEQPLDWDQVDEVRFMAAMFRHFPNPYTVLYLDNLRLSQETANAAPKPANLLAQPEGILLQSRFNDYPTPINHTFPELADITPYKSFTQQSYYLHERALLKYYPRFMPGFVSFDNQGKAYINAGQRIQWRDNAGQWQYSEITPVLIDWAKKQGWAGLRIFNGGQGADPFVQFDAAGDAYVLANIFRLDEKGDETRPDERLSLLLYSNDRMQSWQVYRLPFHSASLERHDSLRGPHPDRPPALTLMNMAHRKNVDHGNYLLLPVKNADGTLQLPEPIKFAEYGFFLNSHSGGGAEIVELDGKFHLAWAWNPHYLLSGDGGSNVYRYQWSRPYIPPTHPGLQMTFPWRWLKHDMILYSKDAPPAYLSSYDPVTGEFSTPLYLGSAGGQMDDHNFPSIVADPQGRLHVVIAGHHNPFVYTAMTDPGDTTVWTNPVYAHAEKHPNASYNTLTCDRDGYLYSVVRSTQGVYNNHLAIYRKKPGEDWSEEQTLVTPFRMMYKVWYNKMSYDVKTDRLFLTYFAIGNLAQISKDQALFLTFRYPDREKLLTLENPLPETTAFYQPAEGEIVTLVSADKGETWRPAITDDF